MGVKKQIKSQNKELTEKLRNLKKEYDKATDGFKDIIHSKEKLFESAVLTAKKYEKTADRLLSQVEPLEKNSNKLFNELQQCKLEKIKFENKYLALGKDNKAMAKELAKLSGGKKESFCGAGDGQRKEPYVIHYGNAITDKAIADKIIEAISKGSVPDVERLLKGDWELTPEKKEPTDKQKAGSGIKLTEITFDESEAVMDVINRQKQDQIRKKAFEKEFVVSEVCDLESKIIGLQLRDSVYFGDNAGRNILKGKDFPISFDELGKDQKNPVVKIVKMDNFDFYRVWFRDGKSMKIDNSMVVAETTESPKKQ